METKIVRTDGIAPTSSVGDGVQGTLRLVADPDLEGTSRRRYYTGTREAEPHARAGDHGASRRPNA